MHYYEFRREEKWKELYIWYSSGEGKYNDQKFEILASEFKNYQSGINAKLL